MNASPTTPFELRFDSLFKEGRGFAFPCDAKGQVAVGPGGVERPVPASTDTRRRLASSRPQSGVDVQIAKVGRAAVAAVDPGSANPR
jgi:hypothetical protein